MLTNAIVSYDGTEKRIGVLGYKKIIDEHINVVAICPECREPVFAKGIYNSNTSGKPQFFSHFPGKSLVQCSFRADKSSSQSSHFDFLKNHFLDNIEKPYLYLSHVCGFFIKHNEFLDALAVSVSSGFWDVDTNTAFDVYRHIGLSASNGFDGKAHHVDLTLEFVGKTPYIKRKINFKSKKRRPDMLLISCGDRETLDFIGFKNLDNTQKMDLTKALIPEPILLQKLKIKATDIVELE